MIRLLQRAYSSLKVCLFALLLSGLAQLFLTIPCLWVTDESSRSISDHGLWIYWGNLVSFSVVWIFICLPAFLIFCSTNRFWKFKILLPFAAACSLALFGLLTVEAVQDQKILALMHCLLAGMATAYLAHLENSGRLSFKFYYVILALLPLPFLLNLPSPKVENLPGMYYFDYPTVSSKLILHPDGKYEQQVIKKTTNEALSAKGEWSYSDSKRILFGDFIRVDADFERKDGSSAKVCAGYRGKIEIGAGKVYYRKK